MQTGVTPPRLCQLIPSVLFEVNVRMKRTSNSGISQARVRRIRRDANRNVDLLNFSMCEDREDINNSFESDDQEAHVSNNAPVVEIESFNHADGNDGGHDVANEGLLDDFGSNESEGVDSDTFIVENSDSEFSDEFVDFNEIDDEFFMINRHKRLQKSWLHGVLTVGFPIFMLTNCYSSLNLIQVILISLLMPVHCSKHPERLL